jgi:hypothetical protein
MGLQAPSEKLQAIQRSMESLAQPDGAAHKTILRGIKQQVQLVLKTQFQTSTDPSGQTYEPTVDGKPALASKKLPSLFQFQIEGGFVRGVAKSKRDMMTALHEGHIFASRQVAAGQVNRFNAKGKLVSASRFEKLKRGKATFSKAHSIGQRVLPPRPIIPEGNELPPLWDSAVRAGVTVGMQWWADRMSK